MSQFEMHLNEIMLDSKKNISFFSFCFPFKPGLSGKHQIGLSYRVCSGLGYGIGLGRFGLQLLLGLGSDRGSYMAAYVFRPMLNHKSLPRGCDTHTHTQREKERGGDAYSHSEKRLHLGIGD